MVPASIKAAAGILLSYAYSSSPGNVWLFGYNNKTSAPEAVVYNGKAWRAMPLPDDIDGNTVAVLGSSNVWALSSAPCPQGNSAGCTVLAHWNGATWSHVTIQGAFQAATSAGGHAWFLTLAAAQPYAAGTPVLYEATGSRISKVKAPIARVQAVYGITAAPNGQLWALASLAKKSAPEQLFHWTGRAWTEAAVPKSVCPPNATGTCPLNVIGTLSYDGKSGFWSGFEAHWTGRQWLNLDYSFSSQLTASGGWGNEGVTTAIPGTNSAWGVGEIDRTMTGTSTDGLITVYGPLP
jgi:hypothetical protein